MSTTFGPGLYTLNTGAATSLRFDLAGSSVGDATAFDDLPLGKGGRLQATIPVTPYEDLIIYVAGAPAADGTPSSYGHGLGGTPYGGCSSAVLRGTTVLLEAGGAGGPGWTTIGRPSLTDGISGGAGGGSGAGAAGQRLGDSTSTFGGGASTSAAGTAGSPGGSAGSGSTGGAGGVSGSSYGGGGGGGYFGGGGGGYDTTNGYGTGGGGGSGHADASATDVIGTNGYQLGDGYVTVLADAASVPSWLTPADGSTFDAADTVDLTYLFQGVAGDKQTQRQYRSSTDGGSTWTTEDAETTDSTTISFTGAAGSYQVQVQTWGKTLGASGWSASLHITLATRPDAPDVSSPDDGATVTDATVDVAWSMTDQQGYQVQVTADNAGSPDLDKVTWDTGQVIDADTGELAAVPLDASLNGHDAHILVYGRADNLWSLAADVKISVDYPVPPAATIVLTEDPTQGRIVLTLTTPDPDSSQVAATSAKVEGRPVNTQVVEWSRSGDAVNLNGDTVFWSPKSDVDYEFRATTIADSGAVSVSDWIGSATGTPDDESPLLDGGTPSAPEGVLL